MALRQWNPGRAYVLLQDRINRVFSDAYGGELTDEVNDDQFHRIERHYGTFSRFTAADRRSHQGHRGIQERGADAAAAAAGGSQAPSD
jgi:hypothetical protein